jgi:hypothetical protein
MPGIKLIEMCFVYEIYVFYLAMDNQPHRICSMKWEEFFESGEARKKSVMPLCKVLAQNFPTRTEKNHKSWSLQLLYPGQGPNLDLPRFKVGVLITTV